MMSNTLSEFKAVFSDTKWSDDFYRFLQVIFHLYPEEKFHYLIAATSKEKILTRKFTTQFSRGCLK